MRRPSITQHLALQVEREAFAAAVLASEIANPHTHVLCSHDPRCPLREALAASVERITADGRALVAEYQHRTVRP